MFGKLRTTGLVLPAQFARDHLQPTRAIGMLHECPAALGADEAQTLLIEAEGGAVIAGLGKDPIQSSRNALALVREVIVVRDVSQHDGGLTTDEVEPAFA